MTNDVAYDNIQHDIERLDRELEQVKIRLVEYERTLTGQGLNIVTLRENFNDLETRYATLKECAIRIDGSLISLNGSVSNLTDTVGDIRGWMLRLLYLAIGALIILALGEKAAEVFKLGVI